MSTWIKTTKERKFVKSFYFVHSGNNFLKVNRVLLDLLQSRPRRQRIFMPISKQQKWNANVTFYLSEIEIYCQNDTLEDFLRFCMNEKRGKFCFISAIFFLENISKIQHFFIFHRLTNSIFFNHMKWKLSLKKVWEKIPTEKLFTINTCHYNWYEFLPGKRGHSPQWWNCYLCYKIVENFLKSRIL